MRVPTRKLIKAASEQHYGCRFQEMLEHYMFVQYLLVVGFVALIDISDEIDQIIKRLLGNLGLGLKSLLILLGIITGISEVGPRARHVNFVQRAFL